MPTYQYACTNPECGNRFELVQSFTDAAADECPVCGRPVRKVYGSVGVVFKGAGFYRTDSRAAASAASAPKAKSESKSDSATATSTKTDSTKSTPSTNGSGSAAKAAASA
ncbi:MAG TPA: FmdB family zinc ribbon protein [Jatrophihabitantaceae bacterium]|nr:FmdB family zinc ribbon protein [Jatrophihabitantaceae bacterium]